MLNFAIGPSVVGLSLYFTVSVPFYFEQLLKRQLCDVHMLAAFQIPLCWTVDGG